MGAGHQVGALELEVVDRRHREIVSQQLPVLPVVEGDEDPRLGTGEKQARTDGVGSDHAGDLVLGKVSVDAPPAPAVVLGLVEVGTVVVQLVAGGGDIGRSRVVGRDLDATHVGPFRQVGRGDVVPMAAAVPGQMDQSIVGAYPEHARLVLRFHKGGESGVLFGAADVLGDGPPGSLQLAGVGPGQVRTDGLPAAASVEAAEKNVAAGIEHVGVMG